MAKASQIGILAEPWQPYWIGWRCDKCRRLLAMKLVREKKSEVSGTLSTYRCKHCGHERVIAARHPPGAI